VLFRSVLAFPEELRLVEMPVDRIDAGRLDPHRAIEKHAPTIEAPVGVVLGHEVQEILRAADGESRDQHVAAALRGLEEDRLQLGEGRIEGAMVAVAVRALEQQEIRLFDLCRILHDRGVAVAQVAAEDQLRTAPPSSIHSSTIAEPRMCPASDSRSSIPGRISFRSPY